MELAKSIITKSTDVFNTSILKYNIKGRTRKNKPTAVAILSAKANNGYYFKSKPYLKFKKSATINNPNIQREFSLSVKSIKKTTGPKPKITEYEFYLMYVGSRPRRSVASSIGASVMYLHYKAHKIPGVRPKSIISFDLGGTGKINESGENRTLRVKGIPGSEFEISITRKSNNKSIIVSGNSTMLDPIVGKIRTIKGVIGKKGTWASRVVFPSSIIKRTQLRGASSTSTTMDVDDTTGVMAGDTVVHSVIPKGTIVKVDSVTDGDTLVTDNATLTFPDNSPVYFKRNEDYYVNITPIGDTTLGSSILTTTPTYTAYQCMRPVLRLQATETNSYYSAPADIFYVGFPDTSSYAYRDMQADVPRKFNINYSFTASGGRNFTLVKTPVFKSALDGDETTNSSDWTNSIAELNGGTSLSIKNIVISGIGTGSCTITADVYVNRWGKESVTMVLNLDNIINVPA